MKEKTLILIDGHALAYRSFFALERTGMKTSHGKPTWAVFGFLKALFDLLADVKPDCIAVSFDMGRETFRTEAYSEYKAHRESMPDSLKEQMGLLFEGVKALGIPIYQLKGYEADDVIGTISYKAKALGHSTKILTGDRDSFQLVDSEGKISVLIPTKGELVEYDRDKVYERMGVWPEQLIDYKALCGDASDNIPGVKGIGEKTTVKLLDEYKTLENLYDKIETVSSKSVKQKLLDDKEMAEKSKFLATIDLNVPVDFDFEHCHLELPDIEKLSDFLREMEFFNFLKNLPTILKPFNAGLEPQIEHEKITPIKQPEVMQGQLSLFAIASQDDKTEEPKEIKACSTELNAQTVDTEEKISALIENLKRASVFSLDTETTSVNALEAKLVGLSVGWNNSIKAENGRIIFDEKAENTTYTAYIPVGHIEGYQLDINKILGLLKPIFEDDNKPKVLQNAKYEINVLGNYGIELKGIILDTMIASYIKNPKYKHGLKQQALVYLNFEMQEIDELIGKGKSAITMDQVPIEQVSCYACADAKATLELALFHAQTIEKDEYEVLYGIEVPLISVLADMERVGVSIDTKYLKTLSVEIQSRLTDVETKIFELAGERFNVNSPKQVADLLFEKLKLPVKGKTQTGFSTSAKVLESLAKEYEIAKLLLEQRHLAKIKSTYIDSLPELISHKDNRIHTSYNQTVTTTGRLSSSNPNLQNIPIRTEIGNRIRAAFTPEDKENSIILSADYSQIELRLLAHVSKDENLLYAYNNAIDIHTLTASKVFDVPIEEVTKEMRRSAKAVNFGIIYGQTAYGLSETLGISPSEAKVFIEKYFATYPKIKEYMQKTKSEAYDKGYVSTLYGRRRYLADELASRIRSIKEFGERAAINAPLQGTAADLIKLAMIKLHKELSESSLKTKFILQVHDELVLEVPKNELVDVTNMVKSCMELGQPLEVPLVVDFQVGSSWMESDDESIITYE